MSTSLRSSNRRKFLKTSLTLTSGFAGLSAFSHGNAHNFNDPESLFVIGPMEGYSPHIGTLVSMLNYNRDTIIRMTNTLTIAELDHLHDPNSNSIGALIMHLGAVDKWYQINSFEGRQEFNESKKKIWGDAMNLGDAARKSIKGHEAKYYLDLITEVREKTLAELKKKDDKWLLAVDPKFSTKRKTNTYWKWFHVCEHESNHRGQIVWLKSRLPGGKFSGE